MFVYVCSDMYMGINKVKGCDTCQTSNTCWPERLNPGWNIPYPELTTLASAPPDNSAHVKHVKSEH